MTAHLTKQLRMAPGGEFRTAFKQVRRFHYEKKKQRNLVELIIDI